MRSISKKRSNLLIVFSVFFFLSALNENAFAGCEEIYFNPAKKTLLPAHVSLYRFDDSRYQDVTGDGNIDIVATGKEEINAQTKKVYIFAGNGTGNFTAFSEITLPFLIDSFDINVIDFDIDGKNDIFVQFNTDPNSVVVYKNVGSGDFTQLSITEITNNEVFFNAVDINNDGISDLITRNFSVNPHTYYIRVGSSDGTFAPFGHLSVPTAGLEFQADFDNNGSIDFPVFTHSAGSGALHIYKNQGNFNFELSSPILVSESAEISAVEDFNNDSKPDILVSDSGVFSVLLNVDGNNFTRTDYSTGENSDSAAVGDFNDDGFFDFVYYNDSTPRYAVYINNGSGNFNREDYFQAIQSFRNSKDFDSDGKADLLSFNTTIFGETQIVVEKNDCNKLGQTKIADFDGDLRSDFAFWNPGNGNWRHYNNFRGEIPTFNWGIKGDIPAPGDFDGDGITDHAVYRPSNGVWYIFNSSDGSFNFTQFGISEDKPVASDFDGDGKTDIAVYRPSGGIWYILNSGNGQVSIANFGISEDKPLPEDYDGDGKSDLAVFRPSTGVWYYLKSSDGNFSAIGWGIETDIPAPADFDGDGKADLTVFRDGLWYVLRSSNFQYQIFYFGLSGDIPQPGDWDGDGSIDLGIYRPGESLWYSSSLPNGADFPANGGIPVSYLLNNQ